MDLLSIIASSISIGQLLVVAVEFGRATASGVKGISDDARMLAIRMSTAMDTADALQNIFFVPQPTSIQSTRSMFYDLRNWT